MLLSVYFFHSSRRPPQGITKFVVADVTEEEIVMSVKKVLAILTLAVAVSFGGLSLTRHMIAVAGEADAERLNRSILEYVAQKNPQAPISAFRRFPETLLREAQLTNIDHCLALAQAEVESEFKHDAVGAAGEIGIYQIKPSTAAILEK